MSITVNDQTRAPPGFRFHPTEEELLNYYLRKKVATGNQKIDLDDAIREVDLNKLEPWEIQEKCMIGPTPQNDWYFFSHKDKKYPTGTRTNRATAAGFWKATGRDKIICSSAGRIGMRKTLVFYKGRAPHGMKLDWIMHEYRLGDGHHNNLARETNGYEDGEWVICRLFKKKNATGDDRKTVGALKEHQYMGLSWKEEGANHVMGENSYLSVVGAGIKNSDNGDKHQDGATLDRLVASHLNGESSEEWKQLSWFFDDDDGVTCSLI